MSLLIPGWPDPEGAEGAAVDAYAWIGELRLSDADASARLVLYVHRTAEAGATWPGGARARTMARVSFACGAPIPGVPDATFPTLEEIRVRAATVAGAMMGGASPEEAPMVLGAIAGGEAIRRALYGALVELAYPDAVEVP